MKSPPANPPTHHPLLANTTPLQLLIATPTNAPRSKATPHVNLGCRTTLPDSDLTASLRCKSNGLAPRPLRHRNRRQSHLQARLGHPRPDPCIHWRGACRLRAQEQASSVRRPCPCPSFGRRPQLRPKESMVVQSRYGHADTRCRCQQRR